MTAIRAPGTPSVAGVFVFLISLISASLQEVYDPSLNCTTTDNFSNIHPTRSSKLEEPSKYHNSKDELQYNDEQRINRHSDNGRLGRYPYNEHISNPFNNLQTSEHLDDEDKNMNLNVRPLNSHLNNGEVKKHSDEQINRNSDNQHYNKMSNNNNNNDDNNQQSNKFNSDNHPKSFNDHYFRTYGIDDNSKENTVASTRNGNTENIDHRVQSYNNQYLNRNLGNQYSVTQEDEKFFNKNPDNNYLNRNEPLNRNLNNENNNNYLNNQHRNLNRNDEYSEGHFQNSNSYRPYDDLKPNIGVENKKFDQYPDDYSGKHINNQNSDRSQNNQQYDNSYKHPQHDSIINTEIFRKHPIELNPIMGLDHQRSDEILSFDDVHSNKHIDDRNSNINLNNLSPKKQFDNANLEDHITESSFEKYLKNSDFDKRFPDQNFNRHLDDLHPDIRVTDKNFERHLIEQPDGRISGIEQLDRSFGNENYDHHIIQQYPNKENEDERINGRIDQLHPERRLDNEKIRIEDATITSRKESNTSHLMTFTRDWEDNKPKLHFPKKLGEERFKMATLHLDKRLFVFDFLRIFLSLLQPRNVPLDLLKDSLEGKINVPTLITQSLHLEVAFLAVISVFAVLMCVVPSTELWLCCRPHRHNYKRRRHGTLICFLTLYTVIIGVCMVTMLICNEETAAGVDRVPETVEAVLQDLRDYHSGTAVQLRKCLTRSLDIASEAILADLDNVDDLLGKPMQEQLSSETEVDVALDALMDVANSTQELAYKAEGLLQRADRARELSGELGREVEELRRGLERATRDCAPEDRSLCAVLDPSGLHLALRLDRVARDERLLRLRAAARENLTEAGRQARGEYLYVAHRVARTTLEARNQIRREVNTARAKVSDEARGIEASNSDLSEHLDTARRTANWMLPYLRHFEYYRWLVGLVTTMCVLLLWLVLLGALCCRCSSRQYRVRSTLLWFVFLSCVISIGLWLVLIAALAVASHAEMLLCRPLEDPEYRAIEAVLETKLFLGRRIGFPLKDLFEKCEEHDASYAGIQLDNSQKLEQLTAHWTWTGLPRALGKLHVDLTGLRILTPSLHERLQNLLYASGANLTEHRIMIQGPILNKDLNGLSEQVENVGRQLQDRRSTRSFQNLGAQMRDLLSRRVKPLMKMQDELVYQLATLELHLQPFQHQVNLSLSRLRTVQYYIDSQGEKMGQFKTKAYVDRLSGYLDQWRAHVLTEMSSGVTKCRPLWDILRGIKLLLCSHILGPLNGFWFAMFVCVVTMLVSTPSAHKLASSYWRPPSSKGSVLLPSRQGSPDTVVMERETWRTPDPPPSMDSW